MEPELLIKCRVEDVPSCRTRKEFLRQFLTDVPETYFLNNRKQAKAHAHRSFSDLLALTRNRFPKTSLPAIIRIVAQLNLEGLCDIVWCTQINKFVVRGRRNNPGIPFITSHTTSYFKDTVGKDGISFKQLMKVRKQQNVNK